MTPAPVWGRSLDLAYSAPPTYLTPVARLPWDTPDTTVAPGLSSAAFVARGPRADPVLQQREAAVGAVTRGLYSEKLSRELRGIATRENIAALDAMLTKYPALAVVQIPAEDTLREMERAERHLSHGLEQVTRLARNVLVYGTSEPSQAQHLAWSKTIRRLAASAPLRELLAHAQEVGSVHAVPLTQLMREEAVRLMKRHAPSVERLGLNAKDAGMLLAMTTEDPRLQTLGELIQMAPRLALRKELDTLMTGGLGSDTIKQLGWVLGMGNEERVLAIKQGLTSLNDSAKRKPLTDFPTLLSIIRPFLMAKKQDTLFWEGPIYVDGFHEAADSNAWSGQGYGRPSDAEGRLGEAPARATLPMEYARSTLPMERARSTLPMEKARATLPMEKARATLPMEYDEEYARNTSSGGLLGGRSRRVSLRCRHHRSLRRARRSRSRHARQFF